MVFHTPNMARKKQESTAAQKAPRKRAAKTAKKTAQVVQPSVNIGLVGHVDHGKTTLTERLSGKWTDTHSEELRRGITIRLGYADSTFYMRPGVKGHAQYTSEAQTGTKQNTLLRKVSFVDAPGHESLMATMLAGAAIMDGALLLVAANEACPQPQTREHLMALEIIGIEKVIVVQNKIDIVSPDQARENYRQIREFLKGTRYENAPVIPISAQQGINISALIAAIEEHIPTPERSGAEAPLMHVARSFDINRPGALPEEMVGGVLGGMMAQGVLKVGDAIEIVPGRKITEHGRPAWKPIETQIIGLKAGSQEVSEITPGGSVGVMTTLDPSIVKSDSLAGSVVSTPGSTPPAVSELTLKVNLLPRVVGARDDLVVDPIKEREPLVLNVNTATTVGVVTDIGKGTIRVALKLPVAPLAESKITISRRFNDRWRLIGYGTMA